MHFSSGTFNLETKLIEAVFRNALAPLGNCYNH